MTGPHGHHDVFAGLGKGPAVHLRQLEKTGSVYHAVLYSTVMYRPFGSVFGFPLGVAMLSMPAKPPAYCAATLQMSCTVQYSPLLLYTLHRLRILSPGSNHGQRSRSRGADLSKSSSEKDGIGTICLLLFIGRHFQTATEHALPRPKGVLAYSRTWLPLYPPLVTTSPSLSLVTSSNCSTTLPSKANAAAHATSPL